MSSDTVKIVTDEELTHRFTYHAPGPKAREHHEAVREAFKEFAHDGNDSLPEGREKALFFTKLEEASFWAHAAIARAKDGTE